MSAGSNMTKATTYESVTPAAGDRSKRRRWTRVVAGAAVMLAVATLIALAGRDAASDLSSEELSKKATAVIAGLKKGHESPALRHRLAKLLDESAKWALVPQLSSTIQPYSQEEDKGGAPQEEAKDSAADAAEARVQRRKLREEEERAYPRLFDKHFSADPARQQQLVAARHSSSSAISHLVDHDARTMMLAEMWSTAHTGQDVRMYDFVASAKMLRAVGQLGAAAPGLSCLTPLLNTTQVQSYINGTKCVASEVLKLVGVGEADRMIKDVIETPHTYKSHLAPCMEDWDESTRSAVEQCKEFITLDSSKHMSMILTAEPESVYDSPKKTTLKPLLHTGSDVKVFNFVRAAELQQLTGLDNGGVDCLVQHGLNATQLASYENATLCLGKRIEQGIGRYASEHVVKDFLEGPDNYDELYKCVEDTSKTTRTAVHRCLHSMAELGAPLPVVNFWWEST